MYYENQLDKPFIISVTNITLIYFVSLRDFEASYNVMLSRPGDPVGTITACWSPDDSKKIISILVSFFILYQFCQYFAFLIVSDCW